MAFTSHWGLKERRHAEIHALRKRGVADTLENNLPRQMEIDAFIKVKRTSEVAEELEIEAASLSDRSELHSIASSGDSVW